jgi:hypothetical protein
MCSRCQSILIGYQFHHSEQVCPFKVLSYCSICATSGHTTSECVNWNILQYRKPQFLEQLISPHILEVYGITSQTPLSNQIHKKEKTNLTTRTRNEKPELIEHLISPHVLEAYGITSETPLYHPEQGIVNDKVIHYVTDTEEHIRAELRCFGITPSQKKGKENKKRLEQFLKTNMGRELICIPASR